MSRTDVVVMKRRIDAVVGEMKGTKDDQEDGMMMKSEGVDAGKGTMSAVTAQDLMKTEIANRDRAK
jgi:hypothetical protein